MKARLTALLVHGMGASPSWWERIVPALGRAGIAAHPLVMPSLEEGGPAIWRDEVIAHAGNEPVILIGHSLGAAVCMEAARIKPMGGLVLLACPPFFPDFTPQPPPETALSVTATVRVARFLRTACANASQVTTESVHFVGTADPWVPVEQVRRLPFPLVLIPRAGHDLNRSANLTAQLLRRVLSFRPAVERLDPGVRLDYLSRPFRGSALHGSRKVPAVAGLGLGECAPPPARLDIEATTRCQLKCRTCARTLNSHRAQTADMPSSLFEKVLNELPLAEDLFFVGLGEPLLHPHLLSFTRLAAGRDIRVRLVTNGLLAAPDTLARLRDAGLSEVTFSLDSTDEGLFRKLRGNASLPTVLNNFRSVPAGLRKSIFTTLSADNAGALSGIVDLAAEQGLPAVAVSDLNFVENQSRSLAQNDCAALIEKGIARARERKILLVGPHFHETPDVVRSYRHSLVRTAADLARRTSLHRHCLAPWRVAVMGADGSLMPCDCAPLAAVGNVRETPFDGLWNGDGMKAWRRRVLEGASADCLVCPRY
jgi:MoaA/NifB/PqqE/SkfB family radical SAM enzyme/predicted alpha/beta hydrolase family esterase